MPYKDPEAKRKWQAEQYASNREASAEKLRQRRKVCRDYVIQLKTKSVCQDCKVDYPHWVLQFDHITGDKVKDVNRLVRDGTLSNVIKEIAKCEIVCANCHASRTWTRANNPV